MSDEAVNTILDEKGEIIVLKPGPGGQSVIDEEATKAARARAKTDKKDG